MQFPSDAVFPLHANPLDAGYDFFAVIQFNSR